MTVMNRNQTAEYLGVAPSTVSMYTRQGKIPHKRVGGRIFFTQEQIDKWLQEEDRETAHDDQ